MERILVFIYKYVPKKYIRLFGTSNFLRSVRDSILRRNGKSRTVVINAHWVFADVHFSFESDLRTAAKAGKGAGIENTLLRHSLSLTGYGTNAPDKVVLDIGASHGYLSMVWAKTISQNGKVFSFEANAHVYASLKRNVERNQLTGIVQPFNRPVYSKRAKVSLQNSSNSSHIMTDGGSGSSDPQIESVCVDEFVAEQGLEKVDFIKIDVDGLEFEILQGSLEVIKKHRPIIIAEVNGDPRISVLMKSVGYTLLGMDLEPYSDSAASNIICLPG